LQRAQQAYEQALEKAPGVIDAKIGIASVLLAKIASAWSPFLQQDLTRVEKLLLEAIEQNANNAWARSMMGRLRRLQDRLEESLSEWETAIAHLTQITLLRSASLAIRSCIWAGLKRPHCEPEGVLRCSVAATACPAL